MHIQASTAFLGDNPKMMITITPGGYFTNTSNVTVTAAYLRLHNAPKLFRKPSTLVTRSKWLLCTP